MRKIAYITLAGFGISFLGTLPLGALNTITMQIALKQHYYNASLFAMGVVVVEMAYLLLTLHATNWIQRQQKLLLYAEWFTVILFLAIAANALYHMFYSSPLQNTDPITETYFLKGALLNSINPAQFPFWLGWNTTLFSKRRLTRNSVLYISYVGGAGLGGFAGLCVFIAAAGILQNNVDLHQQYISAIVAAVCILCATFQLYKNIRKHTHRNKSFKPV